MRLYPMPVTPRGCDSYATVRRALLVFDEPTPRRMPALQALTSEVLNFCSKLLSRVNSPILPVACSRQLDPDSKLRRTTHPALLVAAHRLLRRAHKRLTSNWAVRVMQRPRCFRCPRSPLHTPWNTGNEPES